MAQLPHHGALEKRQPFDPGMLDASVISVPLLWRLADEEQALADHPGQRPALHPVIIDVNLDYHAGHDEARRCATKLIAEAIERAASEPPAGDQGVDEMKSQLSSRYLFASLEEAVIRELVRLDGERALEAPAEAGASRRAHRTIFRIWPDFPIEPLINRSVSTVRVDAARASFSAWGEGIVWGVLDSGIDRGHPHFQAHENLALPPGLGHQDFTGSGDALTDGLGHGTHVAGIIAGALTVPEQDPPIRASRRHRDQDRKVTYEPLNLRSISGMAPKCKLVSLKVLGDTGNGPGEDLTSNLLAAIGYVQLVNDHGRQIVIHGVNLSVGYSFDPAWFACGQSPLCEEVNGLARSGVVVVAAAGNTGYGGQASASRGPVAAGMDVTINDPGNAELAITVGSTHRDMPHVYGVSYFSSKGPTGDGRMKPDLVAPGERILSCAAGKARAGGASYDYVEGSGTSMAASHVSGAIAAFLSARPAFIGRPRAVKEVFLSTATDLGRERSFQGHGLVDLMRAIQSV